MKKMAYVLINTVVGQEEVVFEACNKVEGVVEAHKVYGVYDLILKVVAEDLSELKDIISWKLRRIDNVRSTLTMIVE